MEQKFKYAAHRYINDWLGWEKRFHAALCPEGSDKAEATACAKTLVEVGTYCSVIRNLKKIQEPYRLETACKELLTIRDVLEDEVPAIVENYARSLQSV